MISQKYGLKYQNQMTVTHVSIKFGPMGTKKKNHQKSVFVRRLTCSSNNNMKSTQWLIKKKFFCYIVLAFKRIFFLRHI